MNNNHEKRKPQKLARWFLQWRNFSFKSYWKEFSLSLFYWSLILIAVFTLLDEPIKVLLKSVLIDPIVSFCPISYGSDFVLGIFLIISVIFFLRQLRKHTVPTINSVFFSIAVLLTYFIFFKADKTYYFYHYRAVFANKFTLSTSFVLSILLISVAYKSYLNPLSKGVTKYSLLNDDPSIEKYKDLYGRSSYAATVARHISETSSDVSFAIGIIGDWGSGKSDFMLRLKKELKDNALDENILCDFNPWRVSKADAIIEEFFKTLSKQLRPYNQSISTTISDYSSRVLRTAKEAQFRLVDALIGSWLKEDDIQEKYDTINKTIKSTSKRIVIFIDDVDRLTGKEVMEVLRIIRNTANFANTFFIVGIDQAYIVNVLKNTKDFTNEEEYLKKVFQLTITLPAFKKDTFFNEIKEYLYTTDVEETNRKKIHSALTRIGLDSDSHGNQWYFPFFHHDLLLDQMLDTVRDLKRFCNSFKIAFNILKDETEISDLMVLELIRNKNMLVYNSIRSRRILQMDEDNRDKLKLNTDEWKILKEQISETDKPGLEQSLEFLFTDKEFKNQRKLILSHNFYLYFSYQLFNLISFREFNQALGMKTNEMTNTFKRWVEDGKEKELSRIFANVGDFSDSDQLKKVVHSLLRVGYPNSDLFLHAKDYVFTYWKYNHDRYFESDKQKQKEFLCAILSDNEIDFFTRASLANQFLKSIIENESKEDEFFITKKELRNVIYNFFDQYLTLNPKDPVQTLDFYHLNYYKVEKKGVVYLPAASRRLKRYLLNNELGFEGYVKTLLRPAQVPYIGDLVFEPWLEDIFGDWKIFKQKLLDTSFGNNDYNNLKRIILEHIDQFFSSGLKPLKVKNEKDSKFVDQFLNFKRR